MGSGICRRTLLRLYRLRLLILEPFVIITAEEIVYTAEKVLSEEKNDI